MAVGVRLPGTSGNYVSTPNNASLDASTSLEVLMRCSADSWSGDSTQRCIIAHGTPGTNGFSFQHRSNWGGFRIYLGASTVITWTDPGLVDGSVYWFRLTSDGSTTAIEYASDQEAEPSSWTAGTSGVCTGFVAVISDLYWGSQNTSGAPFKGNLLKAIVKVDGTLVAEWSAPHTGTRYRDSTGKVWTLNGSAYSTVITA